MPFEANLLSEKATFDADSFFVAIRLSVVWFVVVRCLLFVDTAVWTVVDTATVLAGPVATLVSSSFRHEWILIGTDPSNARMLKLKRPL